MSLLRQHAHLGTNPPGQRQRYHPFSFVPQCLVLWVDSEGRRPDAPGAGVGRVASGQNTVSSTASHDGCNGRATVGSPLDHASCYSRTVRIRVLLLLPCADRLTRRPHAAASHPACTGATLAAMMPLGGGHDRVPRCPIGVRALRRQPSRFSSSPHTAVASTPTSRRPPSPGAASKHTPAPSQHAFESYGPEIDSPESVGGDLTLAPTGRRSFLATRGTQAPPKERPALWAPIGEATNSCGKPAVSDLRGAQ
jgi:hypothetical protein